MVKLIWRYDTSNGVDNWTHITPFEYSSKEDFLWNMFLLLENKNETHFTVLDWEYVAREDLEHIEHSIYTLEEWFNTYKVETDGN